MKELGANPPFDELSMIIYRQLGVMSAKGEIYVRGFLRPEVRLSGTRARIETYGPKFLVTPLEPKLAQGELDAFSQQIKARIPGGEIIPPPLPEMIESRLIIPEIVYHQRLEGEAKERKIEEILTSIEQPSSDAEQFYRAAQIDHQTSILVLPTDRLAQLYNELSRFIQESMMDFNPGSNNNDLSGLKLRQITPQLYTRLLTGEELLNFYFHEDHNFIP